MNYIQKFILLRKGLCEYSRAIWIFWGFMILFLVDVGVTIWISVYYTDLKDETKMADKGDYIYKSCTNNIEMVVFATNCEGTLEYHGKLVRCVIFYTTLAATMVTTFFYEAPRSKFKILEDSIVNFAYSMRVISLYVYIDFTSKIKEDKNNPGKDIIVFSTVDFTQETINDMLYIGLSFWAIVTAIARLSGVFHKVSNNKRENGENELDVDWPRLVGFSWSVLVIIANVFPYVYLTSTKDDHILKFTDTRGPGLSSLSLSQYFIATCSVFEFLIIASFKEAIDVDFHNSYVFNVVDLDKRKMKWVGSFEREDLTYEVERIKERYKGNTLVLSDLLQKQPESIESVELQSKSNTKVL